MIKKNQASTISCILKQILRCNLDYKGCYLHEHHRHCLLIFLFEGSIWSFASAWTCCCYLMLHVAETKTYEWSIGRAYILMQYLSYLSLHIVLKCICIETALMGFSTCSLIGEKELQLRGHGQLVMHGNPFDSSRYLDCRILIDTTIQVANTFQPWWVCKNLPSNEGT